MFLSNALIWPIRPPMLYDSSVMEFSSLENSSSKSILDVLETIYLKFWKTIVQSIKV